MPKFKIGQKVRIKKWLNMPENILDVWGENYYAGQVGVVECTNNTGGFRAYDIKIDGKKDSIFCLKEELELFVRVGEQLLFNFIDK